MKKFISLFLISLISMSSIIAEASTIKFLDTNILVKEKLYIMKNASTDEKKDPENKPSIEKKKVKKEDVQVFNSNGSTLKINKNDINLMAKLVYCESRGEPFEGKVAVASVVLNRVINPKFPNTISDVIFQKNAFSCVSNGKIIAQPDESCYDAVYEAIRGKDPTNDALFFYNPTIATCSWMKETSKKDSKKIGNHTFFKQ